MQRIVSMLVCLVVLGAFSPLRADVFDQLQCYRIKDRVPRRRYRADLIPGDSAFPVQRGCFIRTPARLLCTSAGRMDVTPPAQEVAPTSPMKTYLCYRLRCSKKEQLIPVTDEFGSRVLKVKASRFFCTPVESTTTTSTVTTTTTTVPPATTTTTSPPTTTTTVPPTTTTTTLPPPTAGCLVVNEIMTGTAATATEEFIEVLNSCLRAVDLAGAKLLYRSASGSTDRTLVSWEAGALIPAGAHLVYGSPRYIGPKDGEFASTLSGTGGGVAVVDAEGVLLDSVGYGTATNSFVETAPAPAPARGRSIGRLPDGADTDDNAADWLESATITPGEPNMGT